MSKWSLHAVLALALLSAQGAGAAPKARPASPPERPARPVTAAIAPAAPAKAAPAAVAPSRPGEATPAPAAAAGGANPAISAERARTQAYVESVSADQARAYDSITSFGDSLDPSLAELGRAVPADERGAPKAAARPPDSQSLEQLLGSLQAVERPATRRMGRRAAPAAPIGATQLPATPDFSRQKSSFALLIGRDEVTLPASGGPTTGTDTAVDPADVWTLEDIVAEGLAFSPALRQAVSQRETARERQRQARADLFPTLSTRIAQGHARSVTEGASPRSTDNYGTSITRLTQPLYNHTLFNNFGSASAAERAAALRLRSAREAVALSLVQATVNLASSRVTVEFSEELERNLREVLRYLEDRAQTGAASAADLERARTRVLAASQQIIDQQAGYRSALFELERLLGTSPKALRLPVLNQLPPLPQSQAELRALVLERNTDLLALKADIEAQGGQVKAQYGRMLPSLSLSAERDTQDNVQGPTALQRDTRLLAVVTWSLSLGGKEYFGGREASAELNVRKARLDDERRRIEQAIDADFTQLLSATQRIPAGESEQRSALQVVNNVREQLKIGRMGTLLEALDAFDRLYAARARYAQALAQQLIAQAQLLQRLNALTPANDDPLPGPSAPADAVSAPVTPAPPAAPANP